MNRILIVDNSPIIRTGLAKMTESYPGEVLVSGTAANGQLALDWLEGHYADICITDIRMPLMDGLALIEYVNGHYPWMSSIIISSYDDFTYAKSGLELGAVDYLLKPVSEESLYRVLDKAFRRIRETRNHAANVLLLKHLTSRRDMMARWVEHIRYNRHETMPLLIVDTLDMLENWVDGRYDLLNPLAMEWLFLVVEELKHEKITFHLEEGRDLGLGDKLIAAHKVRLYFRICCVRRLEEGARYLFHIMNGDRSNQTRKAIERVQAFLEDNYASKEVSLQQVADHVGFSKNYLSNLFKQETGTTIWNYLLDVRMKKAREMLLNTDLKLYEIADRLGYSEQIYFSRMFKERYGLSPLEFKKRIEQ